MTDDLVKRVSRLYEDKWGLSDHWLARAAIAVVLEEAAEVCDEREPMNLYGVKECAAAIRALKEEV